ncbi:hypothetical protein A7982_13830 [Minicystis rosea]|nr:hypothetical protein A7982_13830 [Minicystis rosea]
MTLAKLTIAYETNTEGVFDQKIQALFNPTQVVLDNNVEWRLDQSALDSTVAQSRELNLESVKPASLTLDLFFDTYEGGPRSGAGLGRLSGARISTLALDSSAPTSATSILAYTRQMQKLTRFNRELHRPSVCKLQWGAWPIFQGVLANLSQEFSLFLEDGTPVRANLRCTFTEYLSDGQTAKNELHSPDVAKTYTVHPGDTLINIAAVLYGDASQWRVIAEANHIQSPRRITAGQVLAIPKLGGS